MGGERGEHSNIPVKRSQHPGSLKPCVAAGEALTFGPEGPVTPGGPVKPLMPLWPWSPWKAAATVTHQQLVKRLQQC